MRAGKSYNFLSIKSWKESQLIFEKLSLSWEKVTFQRMRIHFQELLIKKQHFK